ncbi:cysteine dioxygenase family protein [Paenibacillus sp.]|uniref:cysteine dioxygenase n=1 Tax=Paenibacillus sp. TaxID=58172 RepID=UPI002D3C43F9|nr:cysteine dioxygenase family protein [Paenibacillus sp.]HZG56864.1 cysteine dioxygenase family protein [Paenibacillus sp.]
MELSDCIERQFSGASQWSEASIEEALRGIPELRELASPLATDPEAGHAYGRNVVYADERIEAIVVHLPPGAATAVHDHGRSVGCAIVLEGRMTNETYRVEASGKARRIETATHEAGQWMRSPAGVVHRMRNDGAERLVSLHVYAPPLRGMRRYDAETER